MKYKVGDRVKVLEVDESSDNEKERFLNKTKTIVDIWEDNNEGYYYGLENDNWSPIYFKEDQLEDMNRNYVVVCMRHKGILDGALLFWGSRTEEHEIRNMSGYTIDINKCERFTFNEIRSEFNIIDSTQKTIPKHGDFAVRIDDLLKWGFNKVTVIC